MGRAPHCGKGSHGGAQEIPAAVTVGLLLLGFSWGNSFRLGFNPEDRPTLWIEAESLAHPWDNVTLRCSTLGDDKAQLHKDGVALHLNPVKPPGSEPGFALGKVTEATRGLYRCRYYVLDYWSQFSNPVELTGREILPPPTLSADPGPWLIPGLTTKLVCHGPLKEVAFVLRKVEDPKFMRKYVPTSFIGTFYILHPGSYSCSYETSSSGLRSEPSQTVIIEELDFFPAPRLQKQSNQVILTPGTLVSLLCTADLSDVKFILLREGRTIQMTSMLYKSPESISSTVFIQEGGRYTCRYTLRGKPSIWSRDSNPVEMLVSDEALSKPTVSLVSEDLNLTLGSDLVLRCQGPVAGATFVLLKETAKRPLKVMSSAGHGVDFRIPDIGVHVSGNYSCLYLETRNGPSGSGLSEPLELRVEGPSCGPV
ncbi:PREDICTED: alpha-1B-glycoprotein-like [Elephantulus edwardii]|uniref:alpha-1B-glycoprotein-like n=1 Tax=Elephantulus edwardii TaxID=28737 RepID=UPI0003F0BCE9|nr:PREDICTED: alpha-1B-glycoprotein-like [Elephantulus edwardii]